MRHERVCVCIFFGGVGVDVWYIQVCRCKSTSLAIKYIIESSILIVPQYINSWSFLLFFFYCFFPCFTDISIDLI